MQEKSAAECRKPDSVNDSIRLLLQGVGLLCLCGCGCERHKGSSDVPVVEMHVITAVVAAHGRDTAAFDRHCYETG
ncbi:hypothetical protein NW766_012752 [Fusarium irregulare]|uniref:Uncharacterized protein n=1 Tax=Fusarium irregulare TaxID=2494466 RepID=A0A9W8PD42_9HYPO|nr:hypothetical protein NW766_012752 [Fusarium irregulare]